MNNNKPWDVSSFSYLMKIHKQFSKIEKIQINIDNIFK